jgi:hypothetical protein
MHSKKSATASCINGKDFIQQAKGNFFHILECTIYVVCTSVQSAA